MERQKYSHQPTLKHLLSTEVLAEAQVVQGAEFLDRPIFQVASQVAPMPSSGSLLVLSREHLHAKDLVSVKDMAGVVYVAFPEKVDAAARAGRNSSSSNINGSSAKAVSAHLISEHIQDLLKTDIVFKRLSKLCKESEVSLVVLPGFGEVAQMLEDIRLVFLRETKTTAARINSLLFTVVMEEGMDGLVEQVSEWLERPVAVETADFELLGARDMGATPRRQQKALMESSLDIVKRLQSSGDGASVHDSFLYPVRIGRRVSIPIIYGGEMVAGFISVMVRPQDKPESFIWYLQPAALAALVDISIRSKGDFGLTAVHLNMMKDLLSGRNMSAAELERLERHFGFDMHDGFYVYAVRKVSPEGGIKKSSVISTQPFVGTEMEGAQVYVYPYEQESQEGWRDHAALLSKLCQDASPGALIQIGAGRRVSTLMEVSEAYSEARQALIIGSMINGDKEFVLGYEELGVKRLLYLIIDHPELERFYKEVLEPLELCDIEWESDLVDTLKVYLEHGANLNSAARALFIHRHTLRYRLEQIADILKVDVDSEEVLLNLKIAFLIREMKGVGRSD